MTIQGWFAVVLAVLVALIAVGGVTAIAYLNRTVAITDEVMEDLLPARDIADRLQTSLITQETNLRAFALTRDDAFLANYDEALDLQQSTSRQLREMLATRPDLFVEVETIDRRAREWRAAFARPILAVTFNPTLPVDPAVLDRGTAEFDELHTLFEAQNEHLEAAQREAREELTWVRQLRAVLLGSVFAVLVVACVGFAVLIRTAVINPVKRIARSSREVAEGKFDSRVEIGSGPADLQALAEDIEAMRKRIVTELDRTRDRQAQLEKQTMRLDAQARELRRSNAELEQFAYVTSHDLQEPLRKVASFCQLLEKRYGDVLDDRGRQYIDFAVDGAKRMQVLINDLLAFSRVGRVNDGFKPLSLDEGLDRALSNLAATVEESGARIERPDSLPEVVGDPTLVTMLWQNLIGNAVKFTRPGETPQIAISTRMDSGEWLISVQDNGIGIGEEFADKIFVIFQRLHARDEYTGTGIGLSLCKKIVEYHGGRIWLDTTYSAGARFCFTFPVASGDGVPPNNYTTVTTEGTLA